MKLNQLLDTDQLQQHINNKMIGVQRHPTLPLLIYNYTHEAMYANLWGDNVIDYCRGLIVDDTGEIVARPFKKFHNLNTEGVQETLEAHLYSLGIKPEITEKVDGSLGIFWRYKNDWGVASRGSFTSRQSVWATKWYSHKVAEHELLPFVAKEFTPLFEIVYPENRIVLDYGSFEGLVLLGAVNKHFGDELPYNTLMTYGEANGFSGKHIVQLHQPEALKNITESEEQNREGFVLTFHRKDEEPIKVKVKFDEYVRIHKIVTTTSPKKIWELLSTGDEFEFAEKAPEHFRVWVNRWVEKLTDDYNKIYADAQAIFYTLPSPNAVWTRQERATAAEFFKQAAAEKPLLLPILFGMLDESSAINEYIWKLVKPRGDDKSFIVDGE